MGKRSVQQDLLYEKHRKHGNMLNNALSEVLDCIYCSLVCCAFSPFAKTKISFN